MSVGRPTKFNEEVAESILDLIAEGHSLRKICKRQGMPDRSTVLRWLNTHSSFAAKCARARCLQADSIDEDIDEVINECRAGAIAPDVARVVLSGLQWRASKLAPKKYGEKVEVEQTGEQRHVITFRRGGDRSAPSPQPSTDTPTP